MSSNSFWNMMSTPDDMHSSAMPRMGSTEAIVEGELGVLLVQFQTFPLATSSLLTRLEANVALCSNAGITTVSNKILEDSLHVNADATSIIGHDVDCVNVMACSAPKHLSLIVGLIIVRRNFTFRSQVVPHIVFWQEGVAH